MSILNIQPATREGSHLLISLTGPSGSGKTYSALLLARGLVGETGRIGMLDCEAGRGRLYSSLTPYEYGELTPPFAPKRYREAVREFEAHGCGAIIIDSFSHEWEGVGGCHDIAAATKRNDIGKWALPKAEHKALMLDLLSTRMHVLFSLRARERFVQVKDPNTGRDTIISSGWHEIAERNFIFEMTLSALLMTPTDITMTKCPDELRPIFAELPISVATGQRLAEWVAGGAPIDRTLDILKRAGTENAGEGSIRLRDWFMALTNADKIRIKPHVENFKSIAATVDRLAAEAERTNSDEEVPS